jgi:hypothetical protein
MPIDQMPEFGTDVRTNSGIEQPCAPCPPTMSGQAPQSKPAGRYTSWASLGGVFIPSGTHTDSLPAGTYEYRYDEQVQAWCFRTVPIQTDTLIQLPEPQYEYILSEHQAFWGMQARFHSYGFVHKRGLLLWGPAGSGKTCLVSLLCSSLVERGGIVLSVQDPNAGVAGLGLLRIVEPSRPVTVILEDIDSIVTRHGDHQLLALLDGEMQFDHVVFLATTNYPERLDKRIVDRPSRFDRVVFMGMPGPASRRLYLATKDPTLTEEELDTWVALSNGYGLAHLREMVVGSRVLGQPVEEVVERLSKMHKRQPNSSGVGENLGFSPQGGK